VRSAPLAAADRRQPARRAHTRWGLEGAREALAPDHCEAMSEGWCQCMRRWLRGLLSVKRRSVNRDASVLSNQKRGELITGVCTRCGGTGLAVSRAARPAPVVGRRRRAAARALPVSCVRLHQPPAGRLPLARHHHGGLVLAHLAAVRSRWVLYSLISQPYAAGGSPPRRACTRSSRSRTQQVGHHHGGLVLAHLAAVLQQVGSRPGSASAKTLRWVLSLPQHHGLATAACAIPSFHLHAFAVVPLTFRLDVQSLVPATGSSRRRTASTPRSRHRPPRDPVRYALLINKSTGSLLPIHFIK
jgi:hypothetical protein